MGYSLRMAHVHQEVTPELARWALAQPLLFLASAPPPADGGDLSPRGLDCPRVVSPRLKPVGQRDDLVGRARGKGEARLAGDRPQCNARSLHGQATPYIGEKEDSLEETPR